MPRFWWSHKHKDSGIHRKQWAILGEAKSTGGLGFRDLEAFNKTLLAKQILRLIENPYLLEGQFLKSKYFSSSGILNGKLGHNHSLLWLSFKDSIPLIKASLFQKIGDEHKVHVWSDNWLSVPTTYRVHSLIKILDSNALVASLIDTKS